MTIDYAKWTEIAINNEPFPREAALTILDDPAIDILKLTAAAGEIRLKHFGKKVKVHQINNIQNGYCPEDCGYCGQSKESEADINQYKMKTEDDIIADAIEAKKKGVYRYCMVSSGRGPNDKKADELTRIIKRINDEVGIKTCLSAGLVSDEQAVKFKSAGLDRLNHNLNTSEKHTPNIVSTHTYEDRMNTLNEMNVLDICRNVLSAGFDTVVSVLLLLCDLCEPFAYLVAHSIANLGGKFVY